MKENYTADELRDAANTIWDAICNNDFEYPNSKDTLFSGNRYYWKLNACIGGHDSADAYVCGYANAAKLLARIVICSGRGMDTLVYPIVYLYRHCLEIQLKSLIRSGTYISGTTIDAELDEVLGNHNLMNLWNRFQPFFQEISGHNKDFDSVKKGMESCINQIHMIDPASFAFRYDRSKKSRDHNLEGIKHINILQFCENVEKLTNMLDAIGCEFSEAEGYV